MPARRATLEYRIEFRRTGDTQWRQTEEHYDSLGIATEQLRRFPTTAKRLVQRRVQAGDWTELGADE
jgi:hypothetical protein